MPLPTNQEKVRLGSPHGVPVLPFERKPKGHGKKIKRGEDRPFGQERGTYIATENGHPPNAIYLSVKDFEILQGDCPKHRFTFERAKFLWVIDDFGLRMIWEYTRNSARRPKRYVCHTNLTGGEKAYQGGELWFCKDGRVGINYFSDRYGAKTQDQGDAVLNHFRTVGYSTVVELYPVLNQ